MNYHVEFDIDFKRNPYKGCLIAVEGIDGSGKTTQVKKVAYELSNLGKKVFVTKNPTDGPIGKFIRRVLSGEIKLPAVSFQYLFSADRQAQQVEIIERLRKGEVIITDRYFWSALAYGIVDRGKMNFEQNGTLLLIAQGVLSMYHQFIIPDATFFLDISVEEALERLSGMNKTKELYEQKEQLEKVTACYKWFISKFPKEFTVVNGEKPVGEVTKEIIKTIQNSESRIQN